MRFIEKFDLFLLYFINGGHTDFWDNFNLIISNKLTWIPLYITIIIVFIIKLGWKNGLLLILGAVACYFLTEMISSKILKPLVARPRPCHTNLGIELWLPNGHCGGPYGFVSTHATNTMGLAIYCIQVFSRRIKGWLAYVFIIVLLLYAFLNGFSRIYLAVHYPTDVICGALLGITIGLTTYQCLRKWILSS